MLPSQPLIISRFQFKPNVRFNHPLSSKLTTQLGSPLTIRNTKYSQQAIFKQHGSHHHSILSKKQVIRASSSSASSSTNHSWKYDVFLSFRGEDTRNNFTGHLHSGLVRKGIRIFIDDEGLGRGDEISPALQKAIQESKIAILVFSENYASSTWCLQELVNILGCKESKNQLVYPVFYKVDPSDVRHQRGTFGQPFAEHVSRFKDNMEQVIQWREALTKAANLSGKHFADGGHESKFIDAIVEEISARLLDRIHLSVADYPVGIESRVQDMLELLRIGEDDVHMVGIWGVGGIGKTTIAKAVYNSISHQFECSCFLGSVREGTSVAHGGLVDLQKSLLSKTLSEKYFKFTGVAEGITVIRERLCHKKVLLVLDDVDDLEQLYNLAGGSDWFGAGSRIIITTRDQRLLTAHDIDVNRIYNTKELSHHEALKLFKSNAFKENEQMDDYVELIDVMTRYAQGLPLALVVWGRYLRGASVDHWKVALKRYASEPMKKIQDILRISYDALDDLTKEIYLHIACFYKGGDKNYVMVILDGCDLNPEYGIEVLTQKALINFNENNEVSMHDLLEEMGKEIVRQESPNEPGKRSRLWRYEDVYKVFMENTGTDKVRAIMVKDWSRGVEMIHLHRESFSKMKNLQIFASSSNYLDKFDDSIPVLSRDRNCLFTGDHVNYLSDKLRVLDWENCPLLSLPPSFNPKKLVVLRLYEWDKDKVLEFRRIQKWLGPLGQKSPLWEIQKETLKYVDVSDCCMSGVLNFHDLSIFPNLVNLKLNGWEALIEVEIRHVQNLVSLHLVNCRNLKKFEISDEVRSLKRLDLMNTVIEEFSSSSVRNLINLEHLNLGQCDRITNVPCSVLELPHLQHLDLSFCINLVTFPTKNDDSRATSLHYDASLFINLCLCCLLEEIFELPREIDGLDVSFCSSLRRISMLSNIVEGRESKMIPWMNLYGCNTLCKNLADDYLAKMKRENSLPEDNSEVAALLSLFLSCWQSGLFQVIFPAASSDIPKWFSYRISLKSSRERQVYELEIRFPGNFKIWESKGGLAFYACTDKSPDFDLERFAVTIPFININGVRVDHLRPTEGLPTLAFDGHVWLHYVPFETITRRFTEAGIDPPSNICFVEFILHAFGSGSGNGSCGVHVVTPEFDEDTLRHLLVHNHNIMVFLTLITLSSTLLNAAFNRCQYIFSLRFCIMPFSGETGCHILACKQSGVFARPLLRALDILI